MTLSQFQSIGRDLFTRGLVSSHSGNLSVRAGDRLIITRRGSMLGALQENDLIETGVSKNSRATPLASVELSVHRAIYQQTQAQAVVHAHPPYATAISLIDCEITPSNMEGLVILGTVPVIGCAGDVRPGALADDIAQALKKHQKIIMVRGHGSFAIGQLLEEAYNFTTALEESCHIIYLLKSLHSSPAH
ncbi:MAG: aldolase [Chloroflexi bacterium]|nr:aldolase [Chloroflexota bacterium]